MIKQFTDLKIIVRLLSVILCLLFWVFFSKAIAGNDDRIKKADKTEVYFSRHHTGNVLVEIKAIENKNTAVYIFDAEGALVQRMDAAAKKIDNVLALPNGQYFYQCFNKDAQLKTGKLFVNQNNISYD
jgi:hypothetical protein